MASYTATYGIDCGVPGISGLRVDFLAKSVNIRVHSDKDAMLEAIARGINYTKNYRSNPVHGETRVRLVSLVHNDTRHLSQTTLIDQLGKESVRLAVNGVLPRISCVQYGEGQNLLFRMNQA